MRQMMPDRAFQIDDAPSEPDYASHASWAALPDRQDSADLAPENTRYPEAQAAATADVFFIHPTAKSKKQNCWNTPIDDESTVEDVDLIMALFAGVFNASARVYAPRYRQAIVPAFMSDEDDSCLGAATLAYRDTERAFLYYLKHYNNGRPFILAGHSQGSLHGSRLLQEHIIGTQLKDRLVAAYLIGATILKDMPGISPSRSATDTGVVIGWNTYTKGADHSFFTEKVVGWIGGTDGSYEKVSGRRLLQVNPLSWQVNGAAVEPSKNPGSLPFPNGPFDTPRLVQGVFGADASGEVLITNRPAANKFPILEDDSLFMNPRHGDYHIFDYLLFYESIRKNAIDRVEAFRKKERA